MRASLLLPIGLLCISSVTCSDCRYPSSKPDIFTDFDGTVSANETILILAQAVYKATPPDAVTLPPLKDFLADYETNITKARQEFGAITTIGQELEFESSELRRNVDLTLYNRVDASGMMKYLTLEILEKYAAGVSIRDGWWDFVMAAAYHGKRITILSDNFSVQWIRLILRTSWKAYHSNSPDNPRRLPPLEETISIYCSEIIPARIVPASANDHVYASHGGGDKIKLLKQLVHNKTQDALYLGNTLEDLPPLLGVGVGVLVGAEEDVTSTLKGEGLVLEDLGDSLPAREVGDDHLFEAHDFKKLVLIYSH